MRVAFGAADAWVLCNALGVPVLRLEGGTAEIAPVDIRRLPNGAYGYIFLKEGRRVGQGVLVKCGQ